MYYVTSRAFFIVLNQNFFIMLTYSSTSCAKHVLSKKTPSPTRHQFLYSHNHIIVCWQNYYTLFTPLEFAGTIATIEEKSQK